MPHHLTAENVELVFGKCLLGSGDPAKIVAAEGIVNTFGFNRDEISKYEGSIVEMLECLPDQFQQEKGGGWSFLNACNDKHGRQWTGLHVTMEKLVALGLAAGRARYLMPRDMWKAFPGGVPYFVVTTPAPPAAAEPALAWRSHGATMGAWGA